jgi:hypothetical protein
MFQARFGRTLLVMASLSERIAELERAAAAGELSHARDLEVIRMQIARAEDKLLRIGELPSAPPAR